MEYKGFEVEFNPDDVLLGLQFYNGTQEDESPISIFTIGIIILTITWIWE